MPWPIFYLSQLQRHTPFLVSEDFCPKNILDKKNQLLPKEEGINCDWLDLALSVILKKGKKEKNKQKIEREETGCKDNPKQTHKHSKENKRKPINAQLSSKTRN